MKYTSLLFAILLGFQTIAKEKKFKKVDWMYNTSIYEVNTRQFSASGSFNEVTAALPRIKKLGTDIVWLMPIHPIGKEGRKGTLGSYYSISDYKAINPEFGTLQDFKKLVQEAHSLNMKVIIDVVFNHTSNDHEWIKSHPDFYNYDSSGKIVHPNGWDDVAELNDKNKKLWDELSNTLIYWIKETDLDGFRCDVACMMPLDFWKYARAKVEKVKTVFWLAECDDPKIHEAFDASYAWDWMHATEDVAKGKKQLASLDTLLQSNLHTFPKESIKLFFTSNHDENSWNGTEYEKYGDSTLLYTVMQYLLNGMPLVYNGQEVGNKKRLAFFEKDPIDWKQKSNVDGLITKLLEFKKTHPALYASESKATTEVLKNNEADKIFAFRRQAGNSEVFVVLNFSRTSLMNKRLFEKEFNDAYVDLFSGKLVNMQNLTLRPMRYYVFYK